MLKRPGIIYSSSFANVWNRIYFCRPFAGMLSGDEMPVKSQHFITKTYCIMGKGDKRTLRGKIWRGSFGKTRNKKTNRPHPPKREGKKAN
jgi:ribosomal small subunit protein bTHX